MIRLVAVAIVALLVAASCGDDAEDTTTTTEPPTSTAAPTAMTSIEATSIEAASIEATWIEVASVNLLHGIPGLSGCGEESDFCRAPTRIDILWDLLDRQAGCPEIIALQEIGPRQKELVPAKLSELCGGDHVLLVDDVGSPDQEMILTTLEVRDERRLELAGAPFWSAHWAQLATDDGLIVEVVATHYASSSLDVPCSTSTTCSPDCTPDMRFGDCHPVETLGFLTANAAPGSLQLVVGDLNEPIDHPRLRTLTEVGFVDTHIAAGNGECDPTTGKGCTSGIGGDTELHGLDLPDRTPGPRIDFVLARPPSGCELVVDVDDADGDGTRTGLWANEPLPQPVDGLYWSTDHTGVQADVGLDCA